MSNVLTSEVARLVDQVADIRASLKSLLSVTAPPEFDSAVIHAIKQTGELQKTLIVTGQRASKSIRG